MRTTIRTISMGTSSPCFSTIKTTIKEIHESPNKVAKRSLATI